jgi:cell division protease FtsH
MSDKEKRNTAYHEAGHALVAFKLPAADPLHKVTIIPRGRALGVTMQLPEEDTYNYTKEYMEASLAILLAGKAAEEIFLGSCTTGASNDLERVSERARKMVCEWGMSEEMGPLTFGKKEEQIFLGREIAQHQDYSEETAIQIDREVKKLVLEGDKVARTILEGQREELIRLAEALLEYETLNFEEVGLLMKGEKIQRDVGPETSDQPEPIPEEKEKEEETGQAIPSLVNPDDSPAPA